MDEDDEVRFTRLYAEYYSRVLAYALRRVTREAADEAADEVFLIAWRRFGDVPPAPLPWLLVTARNVLADQRRTDQRQAAVALEVVRCFDSATSRGADEATVERARVLQALAELSEQDRDCLMLTVWDGLTRREAATVAGCATATFTVRLHRARRRLATALQRIDGSGDRVSREAADLDRSTPEPARDHRANPAYGQE